MANGSSTLDELSGLIGKLRNERDKVEKELAKIDEQISAVELTISILRKTVILQEPEAYRNIVSELRGKTQLEALIHIASKSGGQFRVIDAKRLMSEAGLIKNPKNALSMLYTIIARSGKFERIASGEYKLLNQRRVGEQTDLLAEPIVSQ